MSAPTPASGDAATFAALNDFELFHSHLTQLRIDREKLARCLAHRSGYINSLRRQVAIGSERCEQVAKKHPRLKELWKQLSRELEGITENNVKEDSHAPAADV